MSANPHANWWGLPLVRYWFRTWAAKPRLIKVVSAGNTNIRPSIRRRSVFEFTLHSSSYGQNDLDCQPERWRRQDHNLREPGRGAGGAESASSTDRFGPPGPPDHQHGHQAAGREREDHLQPADGVRHRGQGPDHEGRADEGRLHPLQPRALGGRDPD